MLRWRRLSSSTTCICIRYVSMRRPAVERPPKDIPKKLRDSISLSLSIYIYIYISLSLSFPPSLPPSLAFACSTLSSVHWRAISGVGDGNQSGLQIGSICGLRLTTLDGPPIIWMCTCFADSVNSLFLYTDKGLKLPCFFQCFILSVLFHFLP